MVRGGEEYATTSQLRELLSELITTYLRKRVRRKKRNATSWGGRSAPLSWGAASFLLTEKKKRRVRGLEEREKRNPTGVKNTSKGWAILFRGRVDRYFPF